MADQKAKLKALRAHLAQGFEQAKSGQFVEGFSMDSLIDEIEKGVTTTDAGRLLDHHKIKAAWEAKLP
jgi:hypothetical protein